MLLDTGHSSHQLGHAHVWANFTVPDPMQMRKIQSNTYMMTSHDPEKACQLMTIDPKNGFSIYEKL